MPEQKKRRGPAPGYRAKGGHRVTGRVTDRGLAALDLTAAREGKDRSDVIGDLAEHLADTTGPDATQATARDQASQNSHATEPTENGDQP